jgi:hypothetical protein
MASLLCQEIEKETSFHAANLDGQRFRRRPFSDVNVTDCGM